MNPFLESNTPCERRTVSSDGVLLHYWIGGPGGAPPLFFLHGAGMDHRMFTHQLNDLVNDYRVIAWDMRGHGASRPSSESFTADLAVSDVGAVLAAEGIERAVLIGQSLGGMIAQRFYIAYPDAVRAMVMIDSASVYKPYSWWDTMLMRLSTPLLRLWPYENLKRLTASTSSSSTHAQRYIFEVLGEMSKHEFIDFWTGVSGMIDMTGVDGVSIEVPMLIIYGENDTQGTIARDSEAWATAEPNARLAKVPRARHNANQDNPEAVNAELRRFLLDLRK